MMTGGKERARGIERRGEKRHFYSGKHSIFDFDWDESGLGNAQFEVRVRTHAEPAYLF